MVFSSLAFICVFLPVVFLAYCAIPSMKVKNGLLIVASLVFYAYGEPFYILLMIGTSAMNYVFGRWIGSLTHRREKASENEVRIRNTKKAKVALLCVIAANLAILGYCKYTGMFIETADAMFGIGWTIPIIGLPIGISFYTFQAISYVIDIYRGEVTASKNYFKVLLYISFFPQLTAGPIIKYHDVDKQLDKRKVTIEGIATGLRRFIMGLAKKVFIANTMGAVADTIFTVDPSNINIAVAWIGAIAYLLQIYFDFSAYSDMAIGLARMFGFRYKENFNYPYISSSIKEFWRRWHISLSTWFKEYLYIPLGGNRKGRARTGLNKILVFFLCGLWHGASWTFVVWGLFHGLFLLLEEYLPVRKLPKAIGVVYALLVVTIGFVVFRADTIFQAGFMIGQMFTGFHFETVCVDLTLQQLTFDHLTIFVIAVITCMPIKNWIARRIDFYHPTDVVSQSLSLATYFIALILLAVCIITLFSGAYNPFIYFRF